MASLLAVSCAEEPKGESIEEKAASGRAKMVAAREQTLVEAVNALPKSAELGEVAGACDKVRPEAMTTEVKSRCANAHLKLARSVMSHGYAAKGKELLARARAEGAEESGIQNVEKMVASAEAKEKRREEQIQAAAGALVRTTFAKRLGSSTSIAT